MPTKSPRPIAECDYNETQDRQSLFRFEFAETLETIPTRLKLQSVSPSWDKNGTQFLCLDFEAQTRRTKRSRRIPIAIGYIVSPQNKTGRLLRALKIDVELCGYGGILDELKKRIGQDYWGVFRRDLVNPGLFRIAVYSLRVEP